jgi:protein-tyrosine phosphatase
LAGFNTFIDLTSPGENESYETILREEASYHKLPVEYTRFPIGDFGLPAPKEMLVTLDAIDTALAAGRKLYVHCYGGIGRTGTTIGCYLVRHGLSGPQALDQLAAWWKNVPKSSRYPHSPETLQQEQFVREWADHEKRIMRA